MSTRYYHRYGRTLQRDGAFGCYECGGLVDDTEAHDRWHDGRGGEAGVREPRRPGGPGPELRAAVEVEEREDS